MLFDVRIGGDFDGQITYHEPVLAPLPLEQAVIDIGENFFQKKIFNRAFM